MPSKTKICAFTLIELLIVVAIIAILAAIAVPNFLEAQTRSKVSRVKSDMRSIDTGFKSYQVDNNSFPAPSFWKDIVLDGGGRRVFEFKRYNAWKSITTPVAYFTGDIPVDPFIKDVPENDSNHRNSFEIGFGNGNTGYRPNGDGPSVRDLDNEWINWVENGGDPPTRKRDTYVMMSLGPDHADQTNMGGAQIKADGSVVGEARAYDPTNGTVSVGEIYRAEGPSAWIQHYNE